MLADVSDAALLGPLAGADDEQAEALLDNMDFPGSAAAGSMLFTYLKKKVLSASSLPSTTPP